MKVFENIFLGIKGIAGIITLFVIVACYLFLFHFLWVFPDFWSSYVGWFFKIFGADPYYFLLAMLSLKIFMTVAAPIYFIDAVIKIARECQLSERREWGR